MNRVTIGIVAGYATSPDFMLEFGNRLERLYAAAGARPFVRFLFPYGDWSRSRWSQLAEIQRDLAAGHIRLIRSVGGSRIERCLAEEISGSGHTVLIGHSAGGMASVHAAELLVSADEKRTVSVVQIGSPKCPVPPCLKQSVLYIYAVNRYGRRSDAVTRLGRWGRRTPAVIKGVPVIGGHADYFRSGSPYIDAQGKSNLDRTAGCVWSWLAERGV